jgi:hypothetical protein
LTTSTNSLAGASLGILLQLIETLAGDALYHLLYQSAHNLKMACQDSEHWNAPRPTSTTSFTIVPKQTVSKRLLLYDIVFTTEKSVRILRKVKLEQIFFGFPWTTPEVRKKAGRR